MSPVSRIVISRRRPIFCKNRPPPQLPEASPRRLNAPFVDRFSFFCHLLCRRCVSFKSRAGSSGSQHAASFTSPLPPRKDSFVLLYTLLPFLPARSPPKKKNFLPSSMKVLLITLDFTHSLIFRFSHWQYSFKGRVSIFTVVECTPSK